MHIKYAKKGAIRYLIKKNRIRSIRSRINNLFRYHLRQLRRLGEAEIALNIAEAKIDDRHIKANS